MGRYGDKRRKNMYHFQYVAKKELKPAKKQLMELIHKVQDEVRFRIAAFSSSMIIVFMGISG